MERFFAIVAAILFGVAFLVELMHRGDPRTTELLLLGGLTSLAVAHA